MSDQLRKAAQMAYNALSRDPADPIFVGETIDKLRAALAQPEPEPAAWIRQRDNVLALNDGGLFGSDWTPLYTAPPQRKPLTEEEMDKIWFDAKGFESIVRAIERAHGIGGEA